MKNLIIIIGTVLLGVVIVNTLILGDGDSLKSTASDIVRRGTGTISEQLKDVEVSGDEGADRDHRHRHAGRSGV